MRKLKDHLLRRLDNNFDDDQAFSDQQRAGLLFQHDRMHPHQTLYVNYTTYDIRRGRDYLNVTSERCDIMLLSQEDTAGHQQEDTDTVWTRYWYARVTGIYHVNVLDTRQGHTFPAPIHMEFHVRWFGKDRVDGPRTVLTVSDLCLTFQTTPSAEHLDLSIQRT